MTSTNLILSFIFSCLLLSTLSDAHRRSNKYSYYRSTKCTGTARYEVKVLNLVTPRRFPSISEEIFLSPPVVWIQKPGFTAFKLGGMATPGVQDIAETGNFTTFVEELTMGEGKDFVKQVETADAPLKPSMIANFMLTADCEAHQFGVDTMIFPSPDWFVGRTGVSLVNRGRFVNDLVLYLRPYDAGTDSGMTFSAEDMPTNPHMPIKMLDESTLAGQIAARVFIKRMD